MTFRCSGTMHKILSQATDRTPQHTSIFTGWQNSQPISHFDPKPATKDNTVTDNALKMNGAVTAYASCELASISQVHFYLPGRGQGYVKYKEMPGSP